MKDGTMPWLYRYIDLCSYVCARVQTHRTHAQYTVHAKRTQSCVFIKTNSRINVSLDIWYLLLLCVSKKKGPSHHSSLLQRLALLAVERTASSKCCCCFSLHCWLHKTGTNFYVDSFNATPIILTWPLWSPLAILKVTLMEQPVSCWGFSLSFTHAGPIQ